MARRYVTPDGSRLDQQHWYKGKIGEPVHDNLVPYAKTLLQNASAMHAKNRARERIYEGAELANNRAAIAALEIQGVQIARLNATKSIIDTFVSRLSKDRPMPTFVTDNAEWDLKQKSKNYRQFIVGKMLETEYDDLTCEALVDAAVLGNAFTRIDDGENDVFAERIHCNEMLFDDRECKYGKPQQSIRVSRVARDYLAELFPKFRADIERATPSLRRPDDHFDKNMLGSLDDYVDVWEGWHLPATPESSDGRHVLCCADVTLVTEEWLEPRFPWVLTRLFKPRVGIWGGGFVDQLASLQHRVNCIVRDLQLNLAATGRGHFLVPENNDLPVEQLSGWQPFKVKYKGGQPPTFVAPQPFHSLQLDILKFFIEQMFDMTGVSKANATSKSALGAGASGIALDTQYDIDSDRFRMPQRNYMRSRLEGAQRFIDAAKRVARRRENDKGEKRSYVAVSWKSRDAIERLDYSEVELKEGQYCLQMEPSNFLPDTKAGKLSIVEQLAKAGVIPQWMVPNLFDEPDLVQANRINLASYRNTLRKMDDIISVKKPMPYPEPYNDYDLELKISTAYYNALQEERAPAEIQDRMRQYIDLVTEAIKQKSGPDPMAPPPAPPMGPAEQPMPGGVPPMPQGPVPAPQMIGAPPAPPIQ